MKNKNLGKVIGGIVVLAIVLWIIFFVINRRDNSGEIFESEAKAGSEVQKLIDKNLTNTKYYPSNVREVVLTYQKLEVALMTMSYSEEQYEQLMDQMRRLFDSELLLINPRDTHLANKKEEIIAFKKAKKSMPVTNLQMESEAYKYKNSDGEDMATIVGYFLTKEGSNIYNTYEEFLLRKDSNGCWKIVGWRLTDPVDFY